MGTRGGHHRNVDLDTLTPRQRDVLAELARGKTNIETADELGIGFESVKSHVSEILLRLQVSSREEAAAAWQEQGGVVSRLRRTATGFLVTGLGKMVTAGVVALLVGVAVPIFASTGGGSNSGNMEDIYLLDDGREVNQALAEMEATDRIGFRVVEPAGDEWRLTFGSGMTLAPPIFLGGDKRIPVVIRNAAGKTYRVQQLNTPSDPGNTPPWRAILTPLDAGRPDIEVTRIVIDSEVRYAAYGRGRGFLIEDARLGQDDDEAIEISHALFDAAPDTLPPPSPAVPNPNRPQGGGGDYSGFINVLTPGTDHVFDGRNPVDVLRDASRDAKFAVALPTDLPGVVRVSAIRIPPVTANPALRSAYLSLEGVAPRASFVLVQHSAELPDPSPGWSRPIDTDRQDIEAWQIGDFRNPDALTRSFMAVGHGRTVAMQFIPSALAERDALAILISTLEAVQ